MLVRHGSRHSSRIEKLNALAAKLGKNWRYPRPVSFSAELAELGKQELQGLARRLSPIDACDIRSTSKPRCFDSATVFLSAANVSVSKIAVDDDNLRFSDSLEGSDQSEAETFLRGPEMAAIATSANSTVEDLVLAYEGCAYEIMLKDEDSPWCEYFRGDGVVEKLEYYKDLKAWYESGTPRAAEIARDRILGDLLTFDCGSWRFAHAETILPVLNALGLFQGLENLTAAHRDDRRFFRTSKLAPMAANVVVALRDDNKVTFALNERPLRLPACEYRDCCDLDTLRNRLLPTSPERSCS